MNRRTFGSIGLLLLGGLLSALPASGAPGPGPRDGDLRRLFPRKAPVTPGADGLNRIPLPAGILAACRPGLADLRLVTDSGDEVPFAVAAVPAPREEHATVARRWARVEAVRSTILAVAAGAIRPGPLEANPDFSVRARLLAGRTPAQLLLWAALALAVLVLVWLSLRLARQTPAE